jgi:hypothetical protein
MQARIDVDGATGVVDLEALSFDAVRHLVHFVIDRAAPRYVPLTLAGRAERSVGSDRLMRVAERDGHFCKDARPAGQREWDVAFEGEHLAEISRSECHERDCTASPERSNKVPRPKTG